MAILYVLLNLRSTSLYGVVDPRVRLEGMSKMARRAAQKTHGRERVRGCATTLATPLCLTENPVTGFRLRRCLALLCRGRVRTVLVPYDPLATDPPPRCASNVGALVRHRPGRARHLQPRHRGDPARSVHRRRRGDLSFVVGGLAGSPPAISAGGSTASSVGRRHHHGLPAVRAGDGDRGGARQ